jgi:hypothetical protein
VLSTAVHLYDLVIPIVAYFYDRTSTATCPSIFVVHICLNAQVVCVFAHKTHAHSSDHLPHPARGGCLFPFIGHAADPIMFDCKLMIKNQPANTSSSGVLCS